MSYFTDISAALDGHLNTLAAAQSLSVAWENKTFAPQVGAIYLRPTRLPINTIPTGVDSSADQHSGVYQIDIIAPTGGGKSDYMITAEQVTEHFKRGTTASYNGTSIKVQNVSIGSAKRDNANTLINIDITYISFTPPR